MSAALAERHDEREDTVLVGGRVYALRSLERRMDQRLYFEALDFAGVGATAQAVVDEYARLHRKRYGVPFVFGA